VDEYIMLVVFGNEDMPINDSTLKPFYGAAESSVTTVIEKSKDLKDPAVLRHQIEEYMKLRGPVIIVQEILSKIEEFSKVKEDAEIIRDKMDIEDKIDEIDKLYKQIYELIIDIHTYPGVHGAVFSRVNGFLDRIKTQLTDLRNVRDDYVEAFDDGVYTEDYKDHYDAIIANIKSLVSGGRLGSGWMPGDEEDPGGWSSNNQLDDWLNKAISEGKTELNRYLSKLDDLVSKCDSADKKKQELLKMVDDLEAKLNSGKGSDSLRDSLMQPDEETSKSAIDEYRNLLGYDLKPMAEAMRSDDRPYITQAIDILENAFFGNFQAGAPSLSRANLTELERISGFEIDLIIINRTLSPPGADRLYTFSMLTASQYRLTVPGTFYRFNDNNKYSATKNKEFYDLLDQMYSASSNNNNEKNRRENIITAILKLAQDLFKGFSFDPEGALYYEAGEDDSEDSFGNDGDWGSKGKAKEKTKDALNNSIISKIGDFIASMGNKILLLTYDVKMFSCFSTGWGAGEETDEPEISITGVPIGMEVNYFYRSELEYLYHGNQGSAVANLAAVAGMMFLVRFVFNYIATFSVRDVKQALTALQAACSFAGPFAIVIRELARIAFALAESAFDVSDLRTGHKVPITKNNDTWKLSVQGLANMAEPVLKRDGEKKEESGLSYKDYMTIFLLFVDGDTLADRTGDLIQWNVTMCRDGFGDKEHNGPRESAMTAATLVRLDRMYTTFKLTTTADMRMMFLSMPFAQEGLSGVIPPGTLSFSVVDQRGY